MPAVHFARRPIVETEYSKAPGCDGKGRLLLHPRSCGVRQQSVSHSIEFVDVTVNRHLVTRVQFGEKPDPFLMGNNWLLPAQTRFFDQHFTGVIYKLRIVLDIDVTRSPSMGVGKGPMQ